MATRNFPILTWSLIESHCSELFIVGIRIVRKVIFSTELINNTIDISRCTNKITAHTKCCQEIFPFFSLFAFFLFDVFASKWRCVLILFHCNRCKTESINKLWNFKIYDIWMQFSHCYSRHWTGNHLLYHEKRNSHIDFSSHESSFYLMLLVSLSHCCFLTGRHLYWFRLESSRSVHSGTIGWCKE